MVLDFKINGHVIKTTNGSAVGSKFHTSYFSYFIDRLTRVSEIQEDLIVKINLSPRKGIVWES